MRIIYQGTDQGFPIFLFMRTVGSPLAKN